MFRATPDPLRGTPLRLNNLISLHFSRQALLRVLDALVNVVARGSREEKPHVRRHLVLRNAVAVTMHLPQYKLSQPVATRGGLLKPVKYGSRALTEDA